MSASRLAAWMLVLAVCTAWLASAAGVGRPRPAPRTAAPPAGNTEMTALAADVQAQAARLRDRLAEAPTPSPRERNPFVFAERARPVSRRPAPVVEPVVASAPVVSEPVLVLIGIAEMQHPAGAVRTAMIAGPGDQLLMVSTGQTLLGRYEITGVSADAVQLKETSTGTLRTLVLR